MAHLFEPLTIRSVTFSNRVFVSPMCEYSSTDGFANDWHFVHLGSAARSAAPDWSSPKRPPSRLKAASAPKTSASGRTITSRCLARIVRFVHEQGSVAGMQLAHAGRKGEHLPAVERQRRGR